MRSGNCWSKFLLFSHSVMSFVTWLGPLCDLMDCSTPGFLVLHHLRVCSNSCPLSQWCHPTIWSSVIPFSSCLQSFPASGSFQISQLFASGGQSIGVAASTSVLSVNIQDWFPFGWTGTLKSLLQHYSSKASILQHSAFFIVQFSHPYMTAGKTMSLLLNMLSRLVITFLPRI